MRYVIWNYPEMQKRMIKNGKKSLQDLGDTVTETIIGIMGIPEEKRKRNRKSI